MSRFWHLPSQVGNAYESSFFWNKRGFQELCLSFLMLVWWHSAGCLKTNKAWFSVTWWESTAVGALFSMFLYLAIFLCECHRGCTLALRCTAPSLLYFPSFPQAKQEFCVYQDLAKSLILTFFIFPVLWKKILSCMFSWLKTQDNCLMQIVCLGELFAWGSMCRVSSLCKACFWSLGRVPDMPPKSKVTLVPFVWLVPEKSSQKFVYI